MLDLSTLKTWTDGLWAGHQCSAHHSPIFGPVAIAAWWFRGTFERARREGLQSIIDGRDAQIAGLNMQIAVAQDLFGSPTICKSMPPQNFLMQKRKRRN